MKYICLGYIEPSKFETMSESERNAKAGPFEIRPAGDLTEMIRESAQRRAGVKAGSK